MGYKEHMVGSTCVREFEIKAFTRDFDLPVVVLPICSGGEHPICLQTPDDVVFLTADSEQKREEFFQRLSANPEKRGVRAEPAPEVSFGRHYEYGYYNEPRQGNLRRVLSEFNLNRGIYYPRPRGTNVDYTKLGTSDDWENESIYPGDDSTSYASIKYSVPSRSPPPLPAKNNKPKKGSSLGSGFRSRLNRKPSSSEREGNIGNTLDNYSEASTTDKVENLRSLSFREPEANIKGTDSPPYPSAIVEETPLTHASPSLREFVQTFRSQKFKGHLITTLHKLTMNWKDVKLCFVTDKMIVVAGLPPSMYKEFHVGDVIMKVNNKSLPFVNTFHDLIEESDTDEIEVEILRVPNGCLCHVTLPANGRIDSLGVSFSNDENGVEVTAIDEDGLVFKSNQLQNSRPEGLTNPTKRVNWGLVEINQQPVSLTSSRTQVEKLLCDAGIELALVLLPMDLVDHLRKSCR
eukprot:XP_011669791.1 PREDICTED: uncharacterized protein LOC105440897 [Strongylocentrotus purpuratus]